MPRFNKDEYEERAPMQVAEGDYPFSVVGAMDRTSKAGNEMINLEMQFDVGAEKPMTCYESLVFTAKALFKIKQFCDAVGLSEKWESEELEADDCIGVEGKARLAKGEKYMEVQWFCEAKGFSEQPASRLSPADQKKLEKARTAVGVGAEVEANVAGTMEDSDIPF